MSVVEASRFAQVRSPAEIPTQLTVHHPCARRHIFTTESQSRRCGWLWEPLTCCESATRSGRPPSALSTHFFGDVGRVCHTVSACASSTHRLCLQSRTGADLPPFRPLRTARAAPALR